MSSAGCSDIACSSPFPWRDVSRDGYVVWALDLADGNERELLSGIHRLQADYVFIGHVSRNSAQRMERAGMSMTRGPSATILTASCVIQHEATWSAEPLEWSGLEDLAIKGMAPSLQRTPAAGVRYLHVNGHAVARQSEEGLLEVSGTPFDGAIAAASVSALQGILTGAQPVLVPGEQLHLLDLLSEAGFRHQSIRESCVLTPRLTYSDLPVITREFLITPEDVERFGRESGDLNPLHFDDHFAMAHGFERRISHGMIFNGWLTKFLGMEHPGVGTIFLRNSTHFHAPVYPGEAYHVRISTQIVDKGRGAYRIVAQLRDSDQRLVTLSYNEVLNRAGE